MLNSQYFQPMQHKPLPDIRKYSLLTDRKSTFYAIIKPEGMNIYINNGQIFDFNHNELQNHYLKFHFEKLLKISENMKMTIVGVLTSPNVSTLMKHRHTLYNKTKSAFTDLRFVAYDCIFPVFNADHVYMWRYDIISKVLDGAPHCTTATKHDVSNEIELRDFVREVFSIDVTASIIVYDTEGKFIPGMSQLTYEEEDIASYIIEANQRFRAHIKRVVSTTVRLENGDKREVAISILARFKKDSIEIPIDDTNVALQSFIWQNRLALREYPFWFTGYTLLNPNEDKLEYVTIINKFLSFIPVEDNGNRY